MTGRLKYWHRGNPRHTWLGHHFQGQKVKGQLVADVLNSQQSTGTCLAADVHRAALAGPPASGRQPSDRPTRGAKI